VVGPEGIREVTDPQASQRKRHYQAVRSGPGLNPPEQQVTGTR
jgi:hypothetical protein